MSRYRAIELEAGLIPGDLGAFKKEAGKVKLFSGGGGSAQPTTSYTQTSNIPDWLQEPTQRMVAAGEALALGPGSQYKAYTGDRVAMFSPQQQAVQQELYGMTTPNQYNLAQRAVGGAADYASAGAQAAMNYSPLQYNAYQMTGPGNVGANAIQGTGYVASQYGGSPDVVGTGYDASQFGGAQNVTNQALNYFQMAQPGTFGMSQAAQYMSPYQQAVTDIAKRNAVTEAAGLNKQLADKAASAGAFGGSRFGIEQALLGKSLATNLSDIQVKGSQAAYENAQAQYERDRAAQLGVAGQNLQAALGVQSLGAGQNLQAQLANQQVAQQAGLANQAAANQAAQFGATQAMTAQQLNQAARQQTGLSNQAAANQAAQFGATQAMGAQTANQQAALQAALANQQTQYNVGLQNLNQLSQTQQAQEAARQAAMGINLQGANLGTQTGLQAATSLSNLGTAQQAAQLQRLQAQDLAGQQQQQLIQTKLDQAYADWLNAQDYQRNQLTFLSGLIRGAPYATSQNTTSTAAAPSTASQISGLGIAGLGLSKLLG